MGGLRLAVMPRFTVVQLGGTALSLGLGYSRKKWADIDMYRAGDQVMHVERRWDPAHRIDGELSVAHRFASGLRLRAFVGIDLVVGDAETTISMNPASIVVGSETFPTAPSPPPSPWSAYGGLAIGFGAPRPGADPAPLSIKGWYGWQILAIDLPSIVAFTLERQDQTNPVPTPEAARATVTARASLAGFALGGPAVHLAHGHGWRAAGSLAARLVLPLTVLVMGAAMYDEGECAGLECGRERAMIVTAAMTSLVDAAIVSWR
jgi:hypothetical protein